MQAAPDTRENLVKHKKEPPLSSISQEKNPTSCGFRDLRLGEEPLCLLDRNSTINSSPKRPHQPGFNRLQT
ncbi:hypothetical protein I79_002908 [Cricetulus griseus]|uniref:Uncharacterized protein n=1 Tax=Cricetulus griseus TaxID=10029 RepID=G3GYT0_CRIGR|nr:hypothetical protein I79_002908 [Cricetulus griseus]ERE82880.1 hypothetical protein H671_2g7132 [Cricetulus griseus]